MKLRRKQLVPSSWSQKCGGRQYLILSAVALERANLGKVTGSGADLTVELTDLERGRALIKRELLRWRIERHDAGVHAQGVHNVESVQSVPGARQALSVIKAFADHDRDAHPEGEEWTFLRSAFVPYHPACLVRRVRRARRSSHPPARFPESKATSSTTCGISVEG